MLETVASLLKKQQNGERTGSSYSGTGKKEGTGVKRKMLDRKNGMEGKEGRSDKKQTSNGCEKYVEIRAWSSLRREDFQLK